MKLKNNQGFLYIETLFMVAIMLILFTGSALIGRNFLINIIAEYEATKLISSLRLIQEQNRNSYVGREGEFKKIEPKNSMLFNISVDKNFFMTKSMANGQIIAKYYPSKNVNYIKTMSFNNGILFSPHGDIKSFGTVTVSAQIGGKSAERYVIIDRAGRVRMDRNAP